MFNKLSFFLLAFSVNVFSQTNLIEISTLNGVWIAEEYYNAFEENNSAIKSKNAFDYSYPVALRINTSENKKGILNIGYSVLHDHFLHPEVSKYVVKNKDTISEQGSFSVDLNSKDSLGFHKIIDFREFNNDWVSYLSLDSQNSTVTLYRPKNKEHTEEIIKYKRVKSTFNKDYQYPNPLYYYTRSKNLVGNYVLKDINDNLLSNDLVISEDGLVKGYSLLEGFTVYFSTDIYCGLPSNEDLVIFIRDVFDNESKSYAYSYVKDKKGNISLYNNEMGTIEGANFEVIKLTDKVYDLIKK